MWQQSLPWKTGIIYPSNNICLLTRCLKDWTLSLFIFPTTVSGISPYPNRRMKEGSVQCWCFSMRHGHSMIRHGWAGTSCSAGCVWIWQQCLEISRTVTGVHFIKLWQATSLLCWRLVMASSLQAVTWSTPMIRRAFCWIESSWFKTVGEALIHDRQAYSIILRIWRQLLFLQYPVY